MKRWDNQSTDELIDCILCFKTTRELKRFLRDLLTEQEILEFGRRWKAARMLDQRIPYAKIEKETGLSSATIARISKWLNKGTGGYSLALKRLEHSPKN